MLHQPVARPTATWRRIRAALARQPQMSRASGHDRRIHPEWCTCSDCSLERRRGFTRTDLKVIGLGLLAAIVAGAAAWLLTGGR